MSTTDTIDKWKYFIGRCLAITWWTPDCTNDKLCPPLVQPFLGCLSGHSLGMKYFGWSKVLLLSNALDVPRHWWMVVRSELSASQSMTSILKPPSLTTSQSVTDHSQPSTYHQLWHRSSTPESNISLLNLLRIILCSFFPHPTSPHF